MLRPIDVLKLLSLCLVSCVSYAADEMLEYADSGEEFGDFISATTLVAVEDNAQSLVEDDPQDAVVLEQSESAVVGELSNLIEEIEFSPQELFAPLFEMSQLMLQHKKIGQEMTPLGQEIQERLIEAQRLIKSGNNFEAVKLLTISMQENTRYAEMKTQAETYAENLQAMQAEHNDLVNKLFYPYCIGHPNDCFTRQILKDLYGKDQVIFEHGKMTFIIDPTPETAAER